MKGAIKTSLVLFICGLLCTMMLVAKKKQSNAIKTNPVIGIKVTEPVEKKVDIESFIEVRFVKKGFVKEQYKKYNTARIRVSNQGNKDILGIKGTLHVFNMFGDKIINLEVNCEDDVKVGRWSESTYPYSNNPYVRRDTDFKGTEFSKMKYKWVTEMIIFSDGTEVSK